MNQYEKTLNRIAENIIKEKNLNHCGPGLLTGKSGIALFLLYYSKFAKNKTFAEKGVNLITEVFNAVKLGYNFPTFCDGLAGFCWMIQHLVNFNFISKEDVPFLDEMDKILYNQMMRQIKNGDWDFLHGAGGIATYFLVRLHKKNCVGYLSEFVNELERHSTKDDDGAIKWESQSDIEQGAIGSNLGLSHGMASIVSFLSKMLVIENNKQETLQLLNGAVKYLLSQRMDVFINGANFPNVVFNNGIHVTSRVMGWCYGDMGISMALYQASKATRNKDLESLALKVLLDTTNLKSLKKEHISDPSICHGTVGIAHMYNRVFQETKIEQFKDSSLFWFEETFKMTAFENGVADFKKWFSCHENSVDECSVLVGASGIGLALISAISKSNYEWDGCLFLS